MKWTYDKLKKEKNVLVFMLDEDFVSHKYLGEIGEQIKENIPLINAKKGDFWINVPKMNMKLLAKLNSMFLHNSKPLFYYANSSNREGEKDE